MCGRGLCRLEGTHPLLSVTASITRVVSMVIISRISMRSAPSVNPEGNLARGGVGGWTYQKEDKPVLFRASL